MMMRQNFMRQQLPKILRQQQNRLRETRAGNWLWVAALAAGAFLLGRKTA